MAFKERSQGTAAVLAAIVAMAATSAGAQNVQSAIVPVGDARDPVNMAISRTDAASGIIGATPQNAATAVPESANVVVTASRVDLLGQASTASQGIITQKEIALRPIAYASANRDEAVFADPDWFMLDRLNIRDHLVFGSGRHRCAGMAMVRRLLQIALRGLLDETRLIALARCG